MSEFLTTAWEGIKGYLPTILLAIGVLVAGYFLIKLLQVVFRRILKRTKINEAMHHLLGVVLKIVLQVLLFIIVLDILKVPTTPIITALGSVALAVGLALKDNISAITGGMIIMISQPFQTGDYIETDSDSGVVDFVDLLYTKLHTPDNKVVQIPNNKMAASTIVNYSAMPLRRLDMTFSIGYGGDFRKAERIIEQIANAHDKVLSDPPVMVRLANHADSALELTARMWVKNEDYWEVNFDLLEQVKDAFDKEKLDIPYPQMDVHVVPSEPENTP